MSVSLQLTFDISFPCPFTLHAWTTVNKHIFLSVSVHYLNPVMCDSGLNNTKNGHGECTVARPSVWHDTYQLISVLFANSSMNVVDQMLASWGQVNPQNYRSVSQYQFWDAKVGQNRVMGEVISHCMGYCAASQRTIVVPCHLFCCSNVCDLSPSNGIGSQSPFHSIVYVITIPLFDI